MQQLKKRTLAALLASMMGLMPGAAQAATRTYIVTDFDSVRLEAPIAVAIQTKRGTTARGEGDADLLERLELNVSARVLTIRLRRSPFESSRSENDEAMRLFLSVPQLRSAQLSGAGTLAIDGMSGQSPRIISAGSGMLSAAGIDGDTLTVLQQGSGTLKLAGRAGKAIMQLSGSGIIDAAKLTAADLEATAEGSGSVNALATRSAKIVAVGGAGVSVDGHPACTVNHAGSGTVKCGEKAF